MPVRIDDIIGYKIEDILELLEYPRQQLNQTLTERDRDFWEGYMEAVYDLFPVALEIINELEGAEAS